MEFHAVQAGTEICYSEALLEGGDCGVREIAGGRALFIMSSERHFSFSSKGSGVVSNG